MSDQGLNSARDAVKAALDAKIPELFAETSLGPRSYEISFRTADGSVGTVSVQVRDVI